MTRILDSKLSPRRLVLIGAAAAAFVVSGTAVASSLTARTAFPTGSVRMSSTASSVFVDVSVSSPLVKVLSTSIVVPSGRTADVQATFSATLAHDSGSFAYCFGAFTIDGATADPFFQPGNVQLIGGGTTTEPDAVSVAMAGYRKGIGHGTHKVNVYINSAFAGCTVETRTLNVLLNVH